MESRRTTPTCSTKKDSSNSPTSATSPLRKTEALKTSLWSSDKFQLTNSLRKTRDWTHKKWTTLHRIRTQMRLWVTCSSSLCWNQRKDRLSNLVRSFHVNKSMLLSLLFKLLRSCPINQLLSRILGHQSKSSEISSVHTSILWDSSIFGRAQPTTIKETFTPSITCSSVTTLTRVNTVLK